MFTTLMFVPVILSTTWRPRLVRAFEESGQELARAARTPIETVFVFSMPVCVGTALTSTEVVPLLYGSAYADAGPVLAVLALCFPTMYLNILLCQVLIAQKRPTPWMRLMLLASFVNPVLNLVLVPAAQHKFHNGAVGFATSLALTELLITMAGIVIVGRSVLDRRTSCRLGRATLAAGLMATAMLLSSRRGVVVSAPVGALVFAASAMALRVVTVEQLISLRPSSAPRRRAARPQQEAP